MTDVQGWPASYQPPPAPLPAEEPPEAEPRRRRRGRRTARLLVAALLVGVAGGAAVGYRIQADRPPTPLPALSLPDLVHPAKALPKGEESDPLPASQDRATKTAGDLRKLVVPRPSGAKDPENPLGLAHTDGPRWITLAQVSSQYENPGAMFEKLAGADIRRIAGDAWNSGSHRTTMVELYQFRPGTSAGAIEQEDSQLEYLPDETDGAGNDGFAVKGSGNARAFLFPVRQEPGYMPMYQARAVGYKGDVYFEIHIFDTSPVGKDDIRGLAEKQVGRL